MFSHGLQEKDKHLFCSAVQIGDAAIDSFGSIIFPLEDFSRKLVQITGKLCDAFVFSLMKADNFIK